MFLLLELILSTRFILNVHEVSGNVQLLYDTEFNKLELQRNLIQAENVIKEGIEETY